MSLRAVRASGRVDVEYSLPGREGNDSRRCVQTAEAASSRAGKLRYEICMQARCRDRTPLPAGTWWARLEALAALRAASPAG